MGKQQPSFERIIGGTEEQKELLLREAEESAKQTGEELYGEYLVEPTQEEREAMRQATDYANIISKQYGPLNIDAVIKTVDFPTNEAGTFSLPELG